ncbi:DUF971 domain-containing protein [Gluconacetobacter azotocaptans]|uniref:DUF971 domain-containing protein n=1 Tax=Gluconacetobacter azotocaptans TaxID=142834 RepID=A0A7W4PG51_9PROT|nr:TauD/TfdA family dioxygenase [Gluconacetobacter azotocaptans]MBB2189616.1 DUF971 domain-containing protein [Gluconacetobacter azotocaptans]MBM9403099.1 TauD/TfdA family dioxygenase [Gluconacetobacter azotocaptans]GBQ36284.1 putative taurine catabolism dioxygenase [Gluconacetobacter azotocaptans DSM 13594]
MSSFVFTVGADALALRWPDGSASTCPYVWLRDNCPSVLHPLTRERMFDLLSIPADPRPRHVAVADGQLVVTWADEEHVSRFPLDWLARHRPGVRPADPADIPRVPWEGDFRIPRHDAAAILSDDGALAAWMTDLARSGLAIVGGVADKVGAGTALAERIGFLRRTNFGTTFEVVSRPDPNNLAYTAEHLPLHTDLPNQEIPPGFQFLHCLANAAEGGESTFADGVAIAEDLRAADPDAFRLLCAVPIPFRFHDGEADIAIHRPVLTLDDAGRIHEIRYNAHIAGTFDMPAQIMTDYYRAYRAFMTRTRQDRFVLSLKLAPGDMVAFDNRRALHGRGRFYPNTGFRHLHGCYVDRGEFESRLRLLARDRPA